MPICGVFFVLKSFPALPRSLGATVACLGLVKAQTSIPRAITEKVVHHDKMYLQTKKDWSTKDVSVCVYTYRVSAFCCFSPFFPNEYINAYSWACLHDGLSWFSFFLFFFFFLIIIRSFWTVERVCVWHKSGEESNSTVFRTVCYHSC